MVALQEEIQQLKSEKKAIQTQKEAAEEKLADILESLKFLEGKAYEATARIKGQERLLEIFRYLASYQQAVIEEDEEARTLHLLQLTQSAQDAQVMDQNLYKMIQKIINENESGTDE